MDTTYIHACPAQEVPEVLPRKIMLEGRSLLICRGADGDFYTVDEICPHKRKSMAYGVVHNGTLICPHHQYAFDLETGRCNRRRCPPVDVYPTKVEDGEVYVQVPSPRGHREEE